MKVPRRKALYVRWQRYFTSSSRRLLVKDIAELPDRIYPSYRETRNNDLLSLQWPSPPRNVLLVKKNRSQPATDALIEFAKHITSTYPSISLICESSLAESLHDHLPVPIFTNLATPSPLGIHTKTDLVTTFGGDGTILHASSLFSATHSVSPILSFTMGTLGFLGEWKFVDYKRAFREVYMSGAPSERDAILEDKPIISKPFEENAAPTALPEADWSAIRGKSLGTQRGARVLLRNRLKVGIFSSTGERLPLTLSQTPPSSSPNTSVPDVHALNEVLIHRGADPHLTIIDVLVNKRFLTEAVADGMIISTPTGSTAYSLSSGGSIIHPLVSSLLLTPICPRSLSFRPLILPANVEIVLKLSEKNRGRSVEVSVDGMRRHGGLEVGGEVRVTGEEFDRSEEGWRGGVPCIMRGGQSGGDDGWVGGLNGLLKFNYPFGEER
ncbi:NADH kinase pos5 [Xylographa trunciseda]|nr:NADH kinase pos5 [Xylographa trunciseda]